MRRLFFKNQQISNDVPIIYNSEAGSMLIFPDGSTYVAGKYTSDLLLGNINQPTVWNSCNVTTFDECSAKYYYKDAAAVTFIINENDDLFSIGNNVSVYYHFGVPDQGGSDIHYDPVKIGKIDSDYKTISISGAFYVHMALLENGDVYIWGSSHGSYPQGTGMNDGSSVVRMVPVKHSYLTNIKMLRCGYIDGFAISNDDKLYGWGYNGYGCLGMGNSNLHYSSPIQINTDFNVSDIKDICVNYNVNRYSYILLKNGDVYNCGFNSNGELGDNTLSSHNVFTKNNYISNVKEISCGGLTAYFLTDDGDVYVCGMDNCGTTGLGVAHGTYITVPTKIQTLSNIISISKNTGYASCLLAMDSDYRLYGFGYGGHYQLGLGTTTNYNVPVELTYN